MNELCACYGCDREALSGTQQCWRHQGRMDGVGRSVMGVPIAARDPAINALGDAWGRTTEDERKRKGRKGAKVVAKNHVKKRAEPTEKVSSGPYHFAASVTAAKPEQISDAEMDRMFAETDWAAIPAGVKRRILDVVRAG